MMGRNNGKQAPTIPREDSTIGQYKVGVNKSFHPRVSRCHHIGLANSHTCKILVTRVRLLRMTVISDFPHLLRSGGEMLTDGDVIEDNKLCDACSNGPLVCKH